MAKAQIGFDIGSGTLKIAQCDGGRLRRAVAEPLPENLVREGRIVSFDAMADFIKEIARKHRISGKNCAVVLPAGRAYLRRVTMPAMTVDQLQVNLPYEFRDYLTMAKDKYFYDYSLNEMVHDESGAPVTMDLTAAAVAKETIEAYGDMFRRAGFRLKAAAPVECAYENLLRAHVGADKAREGHEYCILDLGHAATRIHIYTGARFEVTRVIDIGSAQIDAAIAEHMSVDEHVARGYKEANHQGAQDMDGVRGVYSAIAVEVLKALNFYSFNNRESQLEDVYCCGGGRQVAAMETALAGTLNMTIHSIKGLLPGGDTPEQDVEFCAAAAGITMQ